MKYLIVNADDFGISPGVNRGIIECHNKGILTSTTAMANMPHFEEAIELARNVPKLEVGLHLNLTTGSSVSPMDKIEGLVDAEGNFRYKPFQLLRAILLGKVAAKEVYTEIEAQILRFKEMDLPLYHLDGHHHIQMYPCIMDMVIELAKKYSEE